MTQTNQLTSSPMPQGSVPQRIVRHKVVSERLSVSRAKLFEMIAQGQFPKPFTIVPGGRAVGWLESDIDAWILQRRQIPVEAA